MGYALRNSLCDTTSNNTTNPDATTFPMRNSNKFHNFAGTNGGIERNVTFEERMHIQSSKPAVHDYSEHRYSCTQGSTLAERNR